MDSHRGIEKDTIKPKKECWKEKDQDRDIESKEQERTAETSRDNRWRRLGSLRQTKIKSRRGKERG